MASLMGKISDLLADKAAKREAIDLDQETFYHATRNSYDEFNDDIWPHFGSSEQANDILKSKSRPIGHQGVMPGDMILPVNIRKQKTLETDDVGEWYNSRLVASELYGNDRLPPEYDERLTDILLGKRTPFTGVREDPQNIADMNKIRDMLEEQGYDSLKYDNLHEGADIAPSYITLRANQIRGVNAKLDPKKRASKKYMSEVSGGALATGMSLKDIENYDRRAQRSGGDPWASLNAEQRPISQGIGDAISKIKLPILGEVFPGFSRFFQEAGEGNDMGNVLGMLADVLPIGLDVATDKIREDIRQ